MRVFMFSHLQVSAISLLVLICDLSVMVSGGPLGHSLEFYDDMIDSGEFGTRIVGGKETALNAYPWIVRIKWFGNMFCGGSLISDRVVLTAAHCLFRKLGTLTQQLPIYGYELVFGDQFTNKTESTEESRKLKLAVYHDEYDPDKIHSPHDIALLILDKPVTYSKYIFPIQLNPVTPSPGSLCKTAGWGLTSGDYDSETSYTLKEVDLPIIDQQVCYNQHEITKTHLTNDMLCAMSYTKGEDSCGGDSGGPLFCEVKEDAYMQVGVTSWGPTNCGDMSFPGIYTRLSNYVDWVKDKLNRVDKLKQKVYRRSSRG